MAVCVRCGRRFEFGEDSWTKAVCPDCQAPSTEPTADDAKRYLSALEHIACGAVDDLAPWIYEESLDGDFARLILAGEDVEGARKRLHWALSTHRWPPEKGTEQAAWYREWTYGARDS